MSLQPFDPKKAIYTPSDAASYTATRIKTTRDNQERGIALNLEMLDNYFAPLQPGQLCAIIAQTSNYKSGFMHSWQYRLAQQLTDEKRDNEIIIHVSVEECVEEQVYLALARESGQDAGRLARGDIQDWKELENAMIRVGSIPIYRIGDSLARAEDMPHLHLSNMMKAIDHLVNGDFLAEKPQVAAIFFDYLQAFPIDTEVKKTEMGGQRRLQVREDLFRLRQASHLWNCPVIVGVQAKQTLSGVNPPIMIPGIYDGEESSAIAQRADRIIQLWMPKMTSTVGTSIRAGDKSFTVEEDLLFIKIGKQRGGLPSGKTWPARIDFTKNEINVVKWSDITS